MATTQITYGGDGYTTQFSYSFDALDPSYVKVRVKDTAAEDVTDLYTGEYISSSVFQVTPAVPVGYTLEIYRDTNIEGETFEFNTGSVIRPADLSEAFKTLRDYSEENFDQAATAAVDAQSDAVASATASAQGYASSAETSKNIASGFAQDASDSANAAATSATAAASSASLSASEASLAATNAIASANASLQAYVDDAEAARDAASASETAAGTSETNAAASATAAASAATAAATNAAAAVQAQVDEATTQASNAASSATSAATSALDAAASATTASSAASTAAADAAASTTSTLEANVAADRAAAETAKDAAEAALNAVLNRYHGAHASDAAVVADINGDPNLTLDAGDLYFNQTQSSLRYYDGSAWFNAAATNVIDTSNLVNVGDVSYTGISANDLLVRTATGWTNTTFADLMASLGHEVFTSADHSKLDGVEAGATADQTGAEIKSLYEGEADTNAFTDADRTKLDGIEDGATATTNITGSEVKSLYEGELDTNAFTDADQTKLAGIEAGATADQTGAEIKSLYEGEADTNAFTDADRTKLDGIEDGATATTTLTGSEVKAAYEAEADTNAFTDAEKAKLSAVEASADVTDATNVAAAGALMESDLTDAVAVKAINQDVSTTAGVSFSTVTATSFSGDGSALTGISAGGFDAGTKAIFVQSAAPTGWTKDTSHNNKALRVVSGTVSSGGSDGFTSTFGTGKSTAGHVLTVAQMPSHNHGINIATSTSGSQNVMKYNQDTSATGGNNYNTKSTGGNQAHSHGLSNFDLAYVDVIIATKD